MREKQRVRRILKLISDIWEKNPELRLLQLLYNALPNNQDLDLYFLEDSELEKGLKDLNFKYANKRS